MASTGKNEREPLTGDDRRAAEAQGRPCPMCRRPIPPRERNPAHPFCSPRCQLADLGRWLDEDYRL